MNDVVTAELAGSPVIDITTVGARSGEARRIEIWMLDVGGRYFITGTPGRRDWLANLNADPTLTVHLKRQAHLELAASARLITDDATRRTVLNHPSARWYRGQTAFDVLLAEAPIIEVTFDDDSGHAR